MKDCLFICLFVHHFHSFFACLFCVLRLRDNLWLISYITFFLYNRYAFHLHPNVIRKEQKENKFKMGESSARHYSNFFTDDIHRANRTTATLVIIMIVRQGFGRVAVSIVLQINECQAFVSYFFVLFKFSSSLIVCLLVHCMCFIINIRSPTRIHKRKWQEKNRSKWIYFANKITLVITIKKIWPSNRNSHTNSVTLFISIFHFHSIFFASFSFFFRQFFYLGAPHACVGINIHFCQSPTHRNSHQNMQAQISRLAQNHSFIFRFIDIRIYIYIQNAYNFEFKFFYTNSVHTKTPTE